MAAQKTKPTRIGTNKNRSLRNGNMTVKATKKWFSKKKQKTEKPGKNRKNPTTFFNP
jgi:hypothetical protein